MANSSNQGSGSNRGFANMDEKKQRESASEGGRAAHASGNAHEFTLVEAREAGRKGGEAAHASGNAHEFTSEEAREAGRKGGEASGGGFAFLCVGFCVFLVVVGCFCFCVFLC